MRNKSIRTMKQNITAKGIRLVQRNKIKSKGGTKLCIYREEKYRYRGTKYDCKGNKASMKKQNQI
jgi:hypothetical protein